MSDLRDTAPTIEEYSEAVKKALLDDYKSYSPEDIENMIKSEDGKNIIEEAYNHNLILFENGEITSKEFMEDGIRAAAYTIDLCF